MLQVVQPIWLFAMAAAVIPLIIHLWNDRKGRTLRIGSIALLEKSSRRQARSPRISEWLLLILRCLLLFLLAFLLAGPFWRSTAQGNDTAWVLVADTTAAPKTVIDSLVRRGYRRKQMDTAGRSWWTAFVALDRQAPANIPFYVLTDGRAVHFNGPRPSTAREVFWYFYPNAPDTAATPVTKAFRSSSDSLLVQRLESRPTGSQYHYSMVAATDPMARSILTDTPILRVSIRADEKFSNDSRYVAAAIRALQQFSRRNIQVSVSGSNGTGLPGGPQPDWLFWLSSKPLPANQPAKNIFQYASGRDTLTSSWVEDPDILLDRRVAGPVTGGVIWKDGYGQPLLTSEGVNPRLYRFFSHFDPAWNGLVWSPRFPVLLEGLLLEHGNFPGRPFVDPIADQRMLDPQQVQPVKISKEAEPDTPAALITDLSSIGWIFVLLLFLSERLLSHRTTKTKTKTYG